MEDSSLLEGLSTSFSYPALASSDYSPGGDDATAALTDGQNTGSTGQENALLSGDSTAELEKGEGQSVSFENQRPAAVIPVEEGFCRISCLFAKNGCYWVKPAHPFGFAQGKEVFPAGTSLQIFAFPDPGYRIAEIAVICGDTVHSVKNRSSFSFSLESDSQIQVIFEKAA